MATGFDLEALATQKEAIANERLSKLTLPLTYDASYDAIIDDVFGPEWDVRRIDVFGHPPKCRAVSYTPSKQ